MPTPRWLRPHAASTCRNGEAAAWMRARGIARPDRFAALLVPGFRAARSLGDQGLRAARQAMDGELVDQRRPRDAERARCPGLVAGARLQRGQDAFALAAETGSRSGAAGVSRGAGRPSAPRTAPGRCMRPISVPSAMAMAVISACSSSRTL